MSTLSLPIRHLLSETALSEAALRFQEAHLATLRRIRASQEALTASWDLLERSSPRYLMGGLGRPQPLAAVMEEAG